ncbi:Rz1-like lysis system protein LysC [Pantoea ananatis]
MLLTGCGVQQKPQVEYRTISQPRLNLPAELTSQIEAPAPHEPMLFGDSVSLNAELYGIVAQCNIDRAAIRQIESSDKG